MNPTDNKQSDFEEVKNQLLSTLYQLESEVDFCAQLFSVERYKKLLWAVQTIRDTLVDWSEDDER